MRERMGGFLKALALFLMVLFVPALRSCANVSYGFPTVVVEASDPFTFKDFHPWHLALNAVVLAAVFMVLAKSVFKNLEKKRKMREGLKYLYFYNGMTYVGFWGVYWLMASKNDLVGAFVMGYSFLLYGPLFLVKGLDLFPDLSRTSPLFGDSEDIKIRLLYVAMSCVWFFVGWFKQLVVERIRARGKA